MKTRHTMSQPMNEEATMTTAPPAPAPTLTSEDRLSPELVKLALTVMLGAVMVSLDATMVNVALDTLARDFATSVATIQWISTAYLLALAIAIPARGWPGAQTLGPKARGAPLNGGVAGGLDTLRPGRAGGQPDPLPGRAGHRGRPDPAADADDPRPGRRAEAPRAGDGGGRRSRHACARARPHARRPDRQRRKLAADLLHQRPDLPGHPARHPARPDARHQKAGCHAARSRRTAAASTRACRPHLRPGPGRNPRQLHGLPRARPARRRRRHPAGLCRPRAAHTDGADHRSAPVPHPQLRRRLGRRLLLQHGDARHHAAHPAVLPAGPRPGRVARGPAARPAGSRARRCPVYRQQTRRPDRA